ncbi:TPA: MerR family transcriptional regulator [Bacillus cereus]|nr:MerR family transcriptional regulator [Bacillus cereus]
MEENKEYSMKEVSKVTGLSSDLLRTYEKEFNLQINRTQGGHRRYTEEDINQLVTIKKKIQDLNWSYKQVRSWLNGEDTSPALRDHEVVSNLEKKIEVLTEKLDQSLTFQATMVQKMMELQTENNEMRKTMLQIGANTEEKEDREEMKRTLGEINRNMKSFDERLKEAKNNKKPEKNKSFLQRIFGR